MLYTETTSHDRTRGGRNAEERLIVERNSLASKILRLRPSGHLSHLRSPVMLGTICV